jgi:hypothetical protein
MTSAAGYAMTGVDRGAFPPALPLFKKAGGHGAGRFEGRFSSPGPTKGARLISRLRAMVAERRNKTVRSASTRPSDAGNRFANRGISADLRAVTRARDPVGLCKISRVGGGESSASLRCLYDHAGKLATLTNAGVNPMSAPNFQTNERPKWAQIRSYQSLGRFGPDSTTKRGCHYLDRAKTKLQHFGPIDSRTTARSISEKSAHAASKGRTSIRKGRTKRWCELFFAEKSI